METVFNDYINKQVGEENKVVKPWRRKVLLSSDDLGNKYLQSLLVNKMFTSLRL